MRKDEVRNHTHACVYVCMCKYIRKYECCEASRNLWLCFCGGLHAGLLDSSTFSLDKTRSREEIQAAWHLLRPSEVAVRLHLRSAPLRALLFSVK